MPPFLLTRIFDLVSSSMSASFARSFIAANNLRAAVVFCCFFDGFAFIRIMTYEITYFHIILLIYNDYLVKLSISLQDLGYICFHL